MYAQSVGARPILRSKKIATGNTQTMMKFLLALAFLASTSLSVQSADNEEAQIDRLRNFLQSGFSLEDIIGDDSQLRSEISRRLSVFMGKARGFDGHRLRDGVDPEVKLNAEGIVRR